MRGLGFQSRFRPCIRLLCERYAGIAWLLSLHENEIHVLVGFRGILTVNDMTRGCLADRLIATLRKKYRTSTSQMVLDLLLPAYRSAPEESGRTHGSCRAS